jgi:CheY-like chemotaxis protein
MTPPRILLVDDDVSAGPVLTEWVSRQGYAVTFVDGPAAATAALQGGEFDLVLSDIQMPGNRRLEWIEQLFRAECPPPVVLMTGSPELETAMRAANLPIAAYLLKPLDHAQLAATLTRLVRLQAQHRAFRAAAREINALVGEAGLDSLSDPQLASRFRLLARELTAESAQDFRRPSAGDQAPWRAAILDTIATLEKTKHSFRSKDLGQLRARLEQFLQQPAAA